MINHAMIFGKPVVSRLADGTEFDLIEPGKNGYILEDYDNSKLADALLAVLDAPDWAAMGAHSRKIVEQRWNIRLMIERVEACISYASARQIRGRAAS